MSVLIMAALGAAACRRSTGGEPARHYGLGRPATPPEIAARDVDAGPDGAGLPPGSGTVAQGEALYARQCAACHGPHGEGAAANPRLIGRDPAAEGFNFGRDPNLQKTIGNYWPYATTIFDYVRRAMPQTAPGSLTNDEVYAITAYLLAANDIIPATASLDSASLAAVRMPYVDRFVRDNRRGGHEIK